MFGPTVTATQVYRDVAGQHRAALLNIATASAQLDEANAILKALGAASPQIDRRSWWHRPVVDDRAPSAVGRLQRVAHRKPPLWRDLDDAGKVVAYQLGLGSLGPSMAFTANLDAEIEALARSKSNAADWLRERISFRLRQAFGTAVALFLVLETDAKGALHAHGVLGLPGGKDTAETARKALRLAGGEWEPIKRCRQALTRSNPTIGWASYASKQLGRPAHNFEGRRIAASRDVIQAARDVFKRCRAVLINHNGMASGSPPAGPRPSITRATADELAKAVDDPCKPSVRGADTAQDAVVAPLTAPAGPARRRIVAPHASLLRSLCQAGAEPRMWAVHAWTAVAATPRPPTTRCRDGPGGPKPHTNPLHQFRISAMTTTLFKTASHRQHLSALRRQAWAMGNLFVEEDRDLTSKTAGGLQIVDPRTKEIVAGAGYTLTLFGVRQALAHLERRWVLRTGTARAA